jgi:hypothetical protein
MVEAPKGYEPEGPPVFDGGSVEDRDGLLRLYFDFRLANDGLDNEGLRPLWSADPAAVFFNTNGHAYHGIDDWLSIWDHYRTRLELARPGGSGTIRITVRGDMALITDDRVGRYWRWRGREEEPSFLIGKPYIRATLVCLREGGGWRAIHGHFSSGRTGKRPDQGGPE